MVAGAILTNISDSYLPFSVVNALLRGQIEIIYTPCRVPYKYHALKGVWVLKSVHDLSLICKHIRHERALENTIYYYCGTARCCNKIRVRYSGINLTKHVICRKRAAQLAAYVDPLIRAVDKIVGEAVAMKVGNSIISI